MCRTINYIYIVEREKYAVLFALLSMLKLSMCQMQHGRIVTYICLLYSSNNLINITKICDVFQILICVFNNMQKKDNNNIHFLPRDSHDVNKILSLMNILYQYQCIKVHIGGYKRGVCLGGRDIFAIVYPTSACLHAYFVYKQTCQQNIHILTHSLNWNDKLAS